MFSRDKTYNRLYAHSCKLFGAFGKCYAVCPKQITNPNVATGEITELTTNPTPKKLEER